MGSCFRTGKKKNSYTVTQVGDEYGPVAGKYNTNKAEQNKWMAESGGVKSHAPRLPANVKPLEEFQVQKNGQSAVRQNGVHQDEDNSNKVLQVDFTKYEPATQPPASPKRRSISPVERKRSPSPARRRSPSPERKRSPSASPERKQSPSPERKQSPSPERKRSPSSSPEQRRSPSPERKRSPSPEWRHSPSPEPVQETVTIVTTESVDLMIPAIEVIEASEEGSSVGVHEDIHHRDQDSDSAGSSPRYTEPPQIISTEEHYITTEDQPEPSPKEVRSVSFSDNVHHVDSSDEDDKVEMASFRPQYTNEYEEFGPATTTVVTVTTVSSGVEDFGTDHHSDDEIRPPSNFENTYDEVQITESPAGTWDARLNSDMRAEFDEVRRSLSSSKASSTVSLDNPENAGVSVVTVTTTYTTETSHEVDNEVNDRIVSMSLDKDIPLPDEIQLDEKFEVNYADPGDPSHTINPTDLY